MKSTCKTFLASSLALSLACISMVSAGELTISWAPSEGEVVAGYEVEVLDSEGRVLEIIDAGEATKMLVTDLEDGVIYGFRVRPYDVYGNRAAEPSRTIESAAKPVVADVDAPKGVFGRATITIEGRNFMPGARVVTTTGSASVVASRVLSHERMLVDVVLTGSELAPNDLLVINPVPKTKDYLLAHQALLDVDSSGAAGPSDRDRVVMSLGARRGDPAYRQELDLSGDQQIDRRDVELIEASLVAKGAMDESEKSSVPRE